MRSAASVLLIASVLAFILTDCDRKRTPTGPGETGHAISGRVVYAQNQTQGYNEIAVRVTGAGIDSTIFSGSDGRFSLSGIGDGKYVLKISTPYLSIEPDSVITMVTGADVDLDDIVVVQTSSIGRGNRAVCGNMETLFTMESNVSRTCTLKITDDSGNLVKTVAAGAHFYFTLPEGAYSIAPEKDGYDLIFTPPSIRLERGKRLERCIFRGEYRGPTLHSISGTARISTGCPAFNIAIDLEGGGERMSTQPDIQGRYVFPHLRDGEYTVRIGAANSSMLTFPEAAITLMGGDTEAPEISMTYIGPVWAGASGKVVDRDGDPVSGVRMYRSQYEYTSLNDDGRFMLGGSTTREKPENTLVYRPWKQNCTFSPDSIVVVCRWYEGIRRYDTTIPDVICTDYRDFTVAEYFPLSSSASWTYERTVNDGTPSERKVSVGGETVTGGLTYRKLSTDGPVGFRLFRVEGEEVFTIFSGQDARFLRFGVVPGLAWTVGFIGGTYAFTGVVRGLEPVTVPAGTFDECLSFEFRKMYGNTTYETWTIWLAKGTGMVRSERTLVNYGEIRERTVDVLKAYTP